MARILLPVRLTNELYARLEGLPCCPWKDIGSSPTGGTWQTLCYVLLGRMSASAGLQQFMTHRL